MQNLSTPPREIWVTYEGREFQVFIGADGHYYLHDPTYHLDLEHMALPTTARQISADGRLGASPLGPIAQNVIPAALSFVPVVGPILGPLASAIGSMISSMFGGNDPTPPGVLFQKVYDLRSQIVAANNALGRPDQFPTLPPGKTYMHPITISGQSILAVLLELWPNNSAIADNNHWICDFAGVNCPGCGNTRKCLYAAINHLAPVAASLSAAAHDTQLRQSIVASLSPGGVAPSTVPSAGGTSIAPGGSFNWGTPIDPALQPAPVVQASMFGGSSLPLLLLGIPLLVAIVAEKKGPKRHVAQRR